MTTSPGRRPHADDDIHTRLRTYDTGVDWTDPAPWHQQRLGAELRALRRGWRSASPARRRAAVRVLAGVLGLIAIVWVVSFAAELLLH